MRSNKINYRINQQIKSDEVRVIDPEGKQIGVLKLSEALKKAQELELDLVEVAPNAKPPVARIIEIGKLIYQEEKKARKDRKAIKGGEIKEIRFTPFIAEADFNTRFVRISEFLQEKNKVRVVVKFGGRQMGSKMFGYNLIERIFSQLSGTINVDMQPKFIGRHLTTVISPLTKVKKVKDNKEPIETEVKT